MRDGSSVRLPYFDKILDNLDDKPELAEAFGRHVHWGYWEDPSTADPTSSKDYYHASDRLCRKLVLEIGQVKAKESILDVGCGFGGTIATLNERVSELKMVGLNIDNRQLERARKLVKPANKNSIQFLQGDACQLPFDNYSFDLISAVECIFHFPCRRTFLVEAHRVLKPNGRLVLSDFVLPSWFDWVHRRLLNKGDSIFSPTYGDIRVAGFNGYEQLAAGTGFEIASVEDITKETLPTYPFVKNLAIQGNEAGSRDDTAAIEWLARRGLVRYVLYRFDRV